MNHHLTPQPPLSTGSFSRRIALCGIGGTGLAVALLTSTGPSVVRAQATPDSAAADTQPPNHFVLSNALTQIIYDTSTFTGEPQLSYQGPIGLGPVAARPIESVTLVGDDILIEPVLYLGQVVTGYLGAMPDAATFYLSMVLPEFNGMSLGTDPVSFSTLAILTTQLTTIAGPALIDGALQEYAVLELEGTAEVVVP
jgi:hypothetical protein